MNFLAHSYLSFYRPGLIVGNYLGDFLRNHEVELLPEEVKAGVKLHRHIDSFTDQHNMVKKGTRLLHHQMGKYAPVVLDIYFDFLLSNNWSKFSHRPLPEFCFHSYKILIDHQSLMPERTGSRLRKMVEDRWLENYQTYAGLERVFGFLSKRAKFKSNLHRAPEVLSTLEKELEAIFLEFFPIMISSVKSEIQLD